jgi:hypothetical protein
MTLPLAGFLLLAWVVGHAESYESARAQGQEVTERRIVRAAQTRGVRYPAVNERERFYRSQQVQHVEAPDDQTWCGLRISRHWEEWETGPPGDLTSTFPPCQRCDYYESIGQPAALRDPDPPPWM